MPPTSAPRDLTRIELSVLLIAVLIAASLWVLRPFLLATVWATMIVVATWPLMLGVQKRVRRRSVAVLVMTGVMLVVLVAPVFLAIQAIVSNLDTIKDWVQGIATHGIPAPPDWVYRIPLAGERIAERWSTLAAASGEELVTRFGPYAADAAKIIGTEFGNIGLVAIQMLLTVIVAAILYSNGEASARGVIRFGRRLAGDRGEEVVRLAGQAVRGVALGIVVTALAQTVLAGIGLAVAGVPFAALLTALILVLCIAQIGPVIVLAAGGVLALLERFVRMGYRAPDLVGRRRLARQLPAADADQARRRPSAAADLRGRARRPVRLRHHRPVRRPGRTRRHLPAARALGRRGRRPAALALKRAAATAARRRRSPTTAASSR